MLLNVSDCYAMRVFPNLLLFYTILDKTLFTSQTKQRSPNSMSVRVHELERTLYGCRCEAIIYFTCFLGYCLRGCVWG